MARDRYNSCMFKKISKRKLKIAAIITLSVVVVFILAVWLFMQTASFGKHPDGARLETIKQSSHYKDGRFVNLSETPMLAEDASYTGMMWEFFFGKKVRMKPEEKLPSEKVDLQTLDPERDLLVWFGHSSFFLQINGKRILVDPVLGGQVSPVAFTTKAFDGSDDYRPADMPEIDLLCITHDHWDHLNYDTLIGLQPKIKKIVTGLGIGSHLEHWGFDPAIIIEKDWNESVDLGDDMMLHVLPARHFSGRGFKRDQTLWSSLLLVADDFKIYMSGDTGYDTHFAAIGEQFGPIDIAFIENGQYDEDWKYIHLLPDQVLQAAIDLKTKRLFPIHSAKYILANHPWDEPLTKITELCRGADIELVTPLIGAVVELKGDRVQYEPWWEAVK